MTNNTGEENKDATLNDVVSLLQHNQDTLDELLTWIKIENVEKVKNVLNDALDTPEKKIVYHLSDGSSMQEIESKSSVSDSQVSRYHKKWFKLGLMKQTGSRGRGNKHIKVFDLEDFGIKIPQITLEQENQQTETTLQPKEDEVSVN